MKKLLLICFLLFSLAGGAYYWFIAHPGYAPKVNSYGNLYNRLIADSAQHIPNKSCLCTNDNDTTPQLFVYMDTVRGFWNGAFHNIGFGSGGGSGVDTIYVTQIGTGSPQIPLVYAVNGSLRVARLVPGIFTTPFMNADSAAGINIDTTGSAGIAYKLWIIAQYGPSIGGSGANIYNSNGTLTGNRHLSMSGAHAFSLDSTFNFEINTSTTGTQTTAFRVGNNAGTSVITMGDVDNANGHTTLIVDDPNLQVVLYTQGVFKFRGNSLAANPVDLKTQLGAPEYTLYFPTSENFFQLDTLARLKDLRDGIAGVPRSNLNIGSAYRLAVPGTNNIKTLACTGCTLDSATTGQIGINVSTSYVGRDTITTITGGSSSTVPDGTNIIRFNNTAPLTYTLTLGTNWHSSHDLLISFTSNGTITNGNPMVTLTIVNGSGHTQSFAVDPSSVTYNAGENIGYKLISTVEQRVAK